MTTDSRRVPEDRDVRSSPAMVHHFVFTGVTGIMKPCLILQVSKGNACGCD